MSFVFLFDIDGTLLSTKGAGRTAMQRAMAEILEVEDALAGESLGGRIDTDLIYGAISRWANVPREHPQATQLYDQICGQYLTHLPLTLKASMHASALPGVVDTLEWLAACEDVLLGVGTGNMAAGATLKLQRCGIADYFQFGGYGDDANDRPGMLEAGWERALAHTPQVASPQATMDKRKNEEIHRVFAGYERPMLVIGDTRLDIDAARRAGFPVAAVATGRDDYHELGAHEPELLWHSMHEGLEWMKSHL